MKLKHALFTTRIFITLFLLPWILMRFTKTEGAQGIAAKYYKMSNTPDIMHTIIGIGWLVLLAAFVSGFKKKISYALVWALHTVGTVMTLPYLIPGTESFNILFMAALPTIGAMMLLWFLREEDTFLSLPHK